MKAFLMMSMKPLPRLTPKQHRQPAGFLSQALTLPAILINLRLLRSKLASNNQGHKLRQGRSITLLFQANRSHLHPSMDSPYGPWLIHAGPKALLIKLREATPRLLIFHRTSLAVCQSHASDQVLSSFHLQPQ